MALVVLGVGVFTVLDARRITVPLSANVVGPRAFPYAVGLAMIASAVAVLLGALRGQRAEPEAGEDIVAGADTDWVTLAKVVAFFGLHYVLVDHLGWALAGALLFAGVAWTLGGSWWRSALGGLALGFLIQIAFVQGLGVSLPAGIFSGVSLLGG